MRGVRSLVPDLESGRYTDHDWERYHHLDLPSAPLPALHEELSALRPLIYLMRRDLATATTSRYTRKQGLAWVLKRIANLEAEIRRRQFNRPDHKASPGPKRAEGVAGVTL